MQIIVVGCGKVGTEITEQLVNENHNVTVVDINPEIVRDTAVKYDVMGIEGNGASYKTLEDADIENADVLIAVTQDDEINLLCCVIARKTKCKTIARVRNPIYSIEREIIQREMGISLIINPERSAAREMRRLIQFPSALEMDSFANGRVELFSFRIPDNSCLIGTPLKELGEIRQSGLLVCVAERDDHIIIPNGDFTAQKGDIISVVVPVLEARRLLASIGITNDELKSVSIIGGSDLTFYLSEMLIKSGLRVKIVEKDRDRCELLADNLPQATIIYGDGMSKDLYKEERLHESDAFVAATGIDEENLIFSLFAKQTSKGKVITKLSRFGYEKIFDSLQLDTVVNPLNIAAERILRFVRALNNSIGYSDMEALYRLRGGAVEALEFHVHSESPVCGVPLKNLSIKKNTLIVAVFRDGSLTIPGGSDSFAVGDSVIIVTANHGYQDLEDVFER